MELQIGSQEALYQIMVARYYSSSLGRFVSTDSGPAHRAVPRSLNRYSYVWNNPLRYLDPSGLDITYFLRVSGGSSANHYPIDPGHIQAVVTKSTGESLGMSYYQGGANDGVVDTQVWTAPQILASSPGSDEVIYFTVPTTDAEAQNMMDVIHQMAELPPNYTLAGPFPFNCATACAELALSLGLYTAPANYTPAQMFWALYTRLKGLGYPPKGPFKIYREPEKEKKPTVIVTCDPACPDPPGTK